MPARRKWALFGSAGDRSDDEIAAIANGVCTLEPDHVVIAEVEVYLRGREPGEVSKILQQACLKSGLGEDQIIFAPSPHWRASSLRYRGCRPMTWVYSWC